MKGKILQKIVALVLVICLTSANFILVGTSAVYALSTNSVADKNTNIIFDAYFKGGEKGDKKTYEKQGTIADGETLYLSIDMKSVKEAGVLNGAKIKIDNANFKIQEVKNNKYVNYTNTEKNEINLVDGINSSVGVIEIELPIKFEKSDNISTDYFSMQNSITLSGKYGDSSDNYKDINSKVETKLTWSNAVETKYNTSIEKYIIESDKILLQQKIVSTVQNNILPKTKETIKLTAPKIDNKLPTKVYVLVNGTKLSDEIINSNYSLTEGTLEFTENFIQEDNKISWKTGTDEYKVIYIYEQEPTEEKYEIKVSANVETQIYGYDKILTGKANATIESNAKSKGTTVSAIGETSSEDIYKGYMYSNTNETEYTENYTLEISDKDKIENINMEFIGDCFKTENKGEKSTNNQTIYKVVKINKADLVNILGLDGTITIETENNGQKIINATSSTDKDGNIVVKLDTQKIKITTSIPQQEGTIKINITKAIKGNAGYSREELKEINAIQTKMQVTTNKEEEAVELILEKELKETSTEATLEMNNENKGNILSTTTKNDVEFVATLKAGTMDTDLYKEPTVKIVLPEEVTNISDINVSALYAENELEIENINIGDNGDGRKTIEVKLKGEQIKYENKVQDGIKVTINAKITLDELTPSKDTKIEMKYTNENRAREEYTTSIDATIQSPISGVILRNILSINNEEIRKTFAEEVITQTLEVDNKAKLANINMAIVNNYDKEIDNVSIIGKLPVEGNQEKVFETTLKSTFKANLQDGIKVQGNAIEILYSEDANANANSDWSANIENAKAYKIVLQDNKLAVGEKLQISYNILIPAELSYNQSTYQKLDLTYDYQGKSNTKTIGTYLSTQLKSTEKVEEEAKGKTETVDGVDVKIVAISAGKELNNEDEIYEGQTIKYKVYITNKTGKDLSNVQINAQHENVNVYDYRIETWTDTTKENATRDYKFYEEKENASELTTTIGTIKNEETKTMEYQVAVRENVESISGKLKITADDMEEKVVDTISNKVKTAELKLTIQDEFEVGSKALPGGILKETLRVKNLTDENKENIILNMALPKGTRFYSFEVEDQAYSAVETEGSNLKIKINKIEAGQELRIPVVLEVSENVTKDVEFTFVYTANTESNTYVSNEIQKGVKGIEVIQIEQEGSIEGTQINPGDELTYTIKVTNSGKEKANIVVKDNIPEALKILKISLNEKEIELPKEDNIIYISDIELEPQQDATLIIDTKLEENTAEQGDISNIVTVQNEVKTFESEAVTYSIPVAQEEEEEPIVEEPTYEDVGEDGPVQEEPEMDGSQENNQGTQNSQSGEEGTQNSQQSGTDSENSDEGENAQIITKSSISGIAWVDQNQNGIREDSEATLSGIKVSLANTETGKYVSDINGNKIEETTDENGNYKFEEIETGKYVVVFQYDNVKYRHTEYRVKTATETTNSDVITSKVSINDDTTRYAVTDTIQLLDESLENIDAGFIENEIFDLSLNKYVSKIIVQNNAGTIAKQYNKEQLAKIEIDSKTIVGSTVLMEYTIEIKNEGELAGYASEIVDYIPKDLSFSSEINPDWYESTDGNLHSTALAKKLIMPGETANITLTLVKTMTDNNIGRTANKAEIAKSTNDLAIPDKDSIAGNDKQGEDDISTAEVIISIRTGVAFTIGIILTIIALSAGGIIVYTVKRKEVKHE